MPQLDPMLVQIARRQPVASRNLERYTSSSLIDGDVAVPATATRNGSTSVSSTPDSSQLVVSVPSINRQQMLVTLVGDSSLISHKWSEKAKKEMLDKQMKKARTAKEAKDPVRDFLDSIYVIDGFPKALEQQDGTVTVDSASGCKFGFPCVAFKAAAVGACRFVDGAKMTEARGAFHVVGELAEITGSLPTMREDMVRVGMGTADIRYRGQFKSWSTKLTVEYNASVISPSQIVNLFNLAGFGIGVGEWRPEKDGSYGRFHVLGPA